MESEIATMRYVRGQVGGGVGGEGRVPVPKVFGYVMGVEEGNPARLPYVLMECVRGNMLYDLGGLDVLSDEQKGKIRRSVASLQVRVI